MVYNLTVTSVTLITKQSLLWESTRSGSTHGYWTLWGSKMSCDHLISWVYHSLKYELLGLNWALHQKGKILGGQEGKGGPVRIKEEKLKDREEIYTLLLLGALVNFLSSNLICLPNIIFILNIITGKLLTGQDIIYISPSLQVTGLKTKSGE